MSNHLVSKTLNLMTVKEVAEILGLDIRTVQLKVKELFPDIVANGKITYLTQTQVTAVKLRIQENGHLATSNDRSRLANMPKTPLEEDLLIQQAMQIQANRVLILTQDNERMKNRLKLQAPLVALADESLRDVTTHFSITNAGKQIGLSQTKIFALMNEKKLLTASKLPTQKALDKGILTLRTNVVCGKNRPQAVMTMANIFNFKFSYDKDFK